MREFDPSSARGIVIRVACTFCKEEGRVSGGRYQSQGEMISCPVCDGTRTTPKVISLDEARALLK